MTVSPTVATFTLFFILRLMWYIKLTRYSDIIKIIIAVILPPLGVFLERGCGSDLLINILLTILGYIPGIIHALYVSNHCSASSRYHHFDQQPRPASSDTNTNPSLTDTSFSSTSRPTTNATLLQYHHVGRISSMRSAGTRGLQLFSDSNRTSPPPVPMVWKFHQRALYGCNSHGDLLECCC